jgi:hypothetical protein
MKASSSASTLLVASTSNRAIVLLSGVSPSVVSILFSSSIVGLDPKKIPGGWN